MSTDTASAPETTLSPYDRVGGPDALRRVVDRFYDIMDAAPEAAGIRAMHGRDLAPMRDRLFEFMSGWLGGPNLYRGCVVRAHHRFEIGDSERDQWLMCMNRALAEADIDPATREMLSKPLFAVADFMRNR